MGSTNGLNEPPFVLPIWILVNEAFLWEKGLPDAIPFMTNASDLTKKDSIVVFANQAEASEFIEAAKLTDIRPLAITELLIFLAVLSRMMERGVRNVIRIAPDYPNKLWSGEASVILNKLSAIAKSH